MVDHQFLGDGFGKLQILSEIHLFLPNCFKLHHSLPTGYHPTYPGNNPSNNLGGPNLGNLGHAMNVCRPQSANANTLMAQMMSSGTMGTGVGGGLGYPPMMPTHGNYTFYPSSKKP